MMKKEENLEWYFIFWDHPKCVTSDEPLPICVKKPAIKSTSWPSKETARELLNWFKIFQIMTTSLQNKSTEEEKENIQNHVRIRHHQQKVFHQPIRSGFHIQFACFLFLFLAFSYFSITSGSSSDGQQVSLLDMPEELGLQSVRTGMCYTQRFALLYSFPMCHTQHLCTALQFFNVHTFALPYFAVLFSTCAFIDLCFILLLLFPASTELTTLRQLLKHTQLMASSQVLWCPGC